MDIQQLSSQASEEVYDLALLRLKHDIQVFDEKALIYLQKSSKKDIEDFFSFSVFDEKNEVRTTFYFEKSNNYFDYKNNKIRAFILPNNLINKIKIASNLNEARKALASALKKFEGMEQEIKIHITHEYVHFFENKMQRLDYQKIGKLTRQKQRKLDKAPKDKSSQQILHKKFYYNTPHEYNAYFIGFLKMLKMNKVDNFNEAFKLLKESYFYSMMNEKYRLKMVKRLYSIYER